MRRYDYPLSGLEARFSDSFTAFKAELQAFVDSLRAGQDNVGFTATVEQMQIIIAASEGRESVGSRVMLKDIVP